MENLLIIREYVKVIYTKYEIYLLPLIKFLVALVSFICINGRLGYMARLNSLTVVLMAALFCSFLPLNATVLLSEAFIVLHLYEFSIECALVVLALFLVMFLLYFRLASNTAFIVLLTPICCTLKIPFVVPVAAGLVYGPVSAVAVACGAIVYSVMRYISTGVSAINSIDAENAVQKYRYVVDGVLNNKAMLVLAAAFGAATIVAYFIRRLSIEYSWIIASVSATLVSLVIIITGEAKYDTGISIPGFMLQAVLSLAILWLLQFFLFNLDYSRTEKLQFEDDEYYYYVKAVPKVTLSMPKKKIKKINSRKK